MLSGPLQVEVRTSPCKIVDDTEVVPPRKLKTDVELDPKRRIRKPGKSESEIGGSADDTAVVFPTADEKLTKLALRDLLQISRRNRNVVICTVDVADLNGFTATRYQRKLLPRRESDYSVLDMD